MTPPVAPASNVSPELGRAARSSATTLFGTVVAAVATFGLTLVVTHGATKTEAGVFFSTTGVFVIIAAFCGLGTDTGLVYFVTRARLAGSPQLYSRYLRAALEPLILASLVLSTVLFVGAGTFGHWLSRDAAQESTTALRALAPLVVFSVVESALLAASRGLRVMRPYVLLEQMARPSLQLVVAGTLLLLNVPVSLAWAWSAPYVVVAVAAAVWWRRLLRQTGPPPTSLAQSATPPRLRRELWRFTAPRSVASMAQIIMQRLDIVLVAAIAGAAPAAVYAAATRFVVLGQMARNSVSLAVQPHLADALIREDSTNAQSLYRVSTAWLMGATWPLFCILAVDGTVLMRIFGPGYDVAGTVLLMLSVAMLVSTFCGDVDVILIMTKRTTWSMWNMLTSVVLNVGLDLWLIPRLGITGAALGWAVAIVTRNLLALIQVYLLLRIQPWGRETASVCLLAAGCFLPLPLLLRIVLGQSAASVAVAMLLGATGYVIGLVVLRDRLHLSAVLPTRLTGRAEALKTSSGSH